ncbi:hypothetical protein GR11A_00228 [Vibrio phage vB_VcorM_GR11A]|nr:hypothetical protein GR11A_00228 [Vibrio phage vB_VcorM_GR11A]
MTTKIPSSVGDFRNTLIVVSNTIENMLGVHESGSSFRQEAVNSLLLSLTQSREVVEDWCPTPYVLIEDIRRAPDFYRKYGIELSRTEEGEDAAVYLPLWVAYIFPQDAHISNIKPDTPLLHQLRYEVAADTTLLAELDLDTISKSLDIEQTCYFTVDIDQPVAQRPDDIEVDAIPHLVTLSPSVISLLEVIEKSETGSNEMNKDTVHGDAGHDLLHIQGRDMYYVLGGAILNAVIDKCQDSENFTEDSWDEAALFMQGSSITDPYEILKGYRSWPETDIVDLLRNAAEDAVEMADELTQVRVTAGQVISDSNMEITEDQALDALAGSNMNLRRALEKVIAQQNQHPIQDVNEKLMYDMSDGLPTAKKHIREFVNGKLTVLDGEPLDRAQYEFALYDHLANTRGCKRVELYIPADQIDAAYNSYLNGVPIVVAHIKQGTIQ